jgi:hypothetical protein
MVWLVTCTLLLGVNLLLWYLIGGNFGLLLVGLSFSLTPPTVSLIRRFSESGVRKHPVPPGQENAIGVLSLALSITSVGAFFRAIEMRNGPAASVEMASLYLLLLFATSEILAVLLGFAARRTNVGRVALLLSSLWFLLFVVSALTILLAAWWRTLG